MTEVVYKSCFGINIYFYFIIERGTIMRLFQKPIEIPFYNTASEEEPEHLVFYFREDIGLNLHHWYWHLVYPQYGPREVVNKDRRGELFYYMHEQMVAR